LTEPKPETPIRFYGRRRGHKLRPGRQTLIDDLLPRLRLSPPPGGGSLDLQAAFPDPVTDIWLEVGFGAGEHLAQLAEAHPDIGFIGCEPFINGVASLLSRIEKNGLTNIRVFDDDARKLIPSLPDASIGRVFVLFSDPWPKKRHHRRRFISDQTLDDLARTLTDGGELRLASDHGGYISDILALVTRHPALSWQARSKKDWTEPPSDWIETRYEKKAQKQGDRPLYLRFSRRPRVPEGGAGNAENH
jgi:tRNA (guanine-N7-)-methyltransferase